MQYDWMYGQRQESCGCTLARWRIDRAGLNSADKEERGAEAKALPIEAEELSLNSRFDLRGRNYNPSPIPVEMQD